MIAIVENYKRILKYIERYNIEFSESTCFPQLIAVSKTFQKDKIQLIIDEGQRIFGENKVQEALLKWSDLKKVNKDIELHLIGPLQSNKVKDALEVFDVIQTIDREKIVKKIKQHLELKKKKLQFFIQVNIGGEPQKNGLKISELSDFLDWCNKDMNFPINGLMCIPPLNEEPSYFFNVLKNLCKKYNLKEASMGMTGDFPKAIQYGATYLRIGSAIFGQRN